MFCDRRSRAGGWGDAGPVGGVVLVDWSCECQNLETRVCVRMCVHVCVCVDACVCVCTLRLLQVMERALRKWWS